MNAEFDIDDLFPDRPRGLAQIRMRRASDLQVDAVRPLTEDDFDRLDTSRGYTQSPTVTRMRESHHTLARLLASGMSREQAALLTNYTPAYIRILCDTPAFQELLTLYTQEFIGQARDVQAQLLEVALDSLNEYRERLETRPEELSAKDLLSAAKLGLDRSGFGPTSTNLNLNAEISEERLRQLREMAEQNSRASVVIGIHHKLGERDESVQTDAGGVLAAGPPEGTADADDGDATDRPALPSAGNEDVAGGA